MTGAGGSVPGAEVLRAFGVAGSTPVPLAGGRGLTWRAECIVLRPHDGPAVTDWRAGVLAELEHAAESEHPAEFRTPRPVATRDGSWRSGDWEAWEYVAGAADESRVEDVIRVGRAFHRAIAGLERPAFLGTDPGTDTADTAGPEVTEAKAVTAASADTVASAVTDPWSRADRMAWGEEPLPADPTLDRLAAAFRPVRAPSQLVHGDLLCNVLFADGQPPTIIDWPPYWRPAEFGPAIAAVDAVCWHGFPVGRLAALGRTTHGAAAEADEPEWTSLLTRALVFRIATLHLLGVWDAAAVAHHRPVVDALVGRRTPTSPR
ncbi:hypothetical protein [Curtobacterium sp. MCJR17_020]|uniref:hypothetical protein n=1 Tax=Curtobacterium sp. MCJR17_020 TaxID=2175619 RepID=UPI000DA6F2E2|nr:hypothetical protein [Curtobacterium sp. MCJR17_020]WIE73653.1 hypothetical protein DEJ14_007715 [Curtobacterium sp. MCJR17_020]